MPVLCRRRVYTHSCHLARTTPKVDDMRQQLPADWAKLAERKGIRPSFRAISQRAGVAITTVTRLITEGRTSPETVTAVAEALGVTEAKIHELAGLAAGDLGPWSPPVEAHQLGGPEREALEQLIRVMAKGAAHDGRSPEAQKKSGAATTDDSGASVVELRPQQAARKGRKMRPDQEHPDEP